MRRTQAGTRASAQGRKPGNERTRVSQGTCKLVLPGPDLDRCGTWLEYWWEETVRSGDVEQKAGKGGAGAGADPAV